MRRENEKGFLLFPVIIVVSMFAGVIFMTAPNSIKTSVAKAIHLEK